MSPRILTALALLGGVGVRVMRLMDNRSLWIDEAMLAANVIDRDALGLLRPLDHHQGAPVLFLLLTKACTLVMGTSEIVLRLLPFLASIASLFLFLAVAKHFLDRWMVPLAMLLFSFGYWLVYYAQEFKQYSVDVAVGLALVYGALRILRADPVPARSIVALAVGGVVGVFLSHPAVFVLAAVGSILIASSWFQSSRFPRRAYVLIAAGWGICFALNYLLFMRSLGVNDSLLLYWQDGFIPLSGGVAAVNGTFDVFRNYLVFIGFGDGWEILALALIGVAAVMAVVRRAWSEGILVLMLTIAVCAAAAGKYPLADRLALYLTPAAILLVVRGLQILGEGRPVAVTLLLAAIMALPALKSTRQIAQGAMRNEELRPLIAYLKENRQPGERVYVYYGAVPASHYYGRQIRGASIEFQTGRSSRKDRTNYLSDIDAMNGWDRYWFVIGHVHADEDKFFLSRLRGKILDQQHRPGASLYLFDNTSQGADASPKGTSQAK